MSWRPAPAVQAALAEATRRWPKRSRVADGTIGDLRHSSTTSDHNPDSRGVVLAFDLTHDPRNGCDAHALVRAAVDRRDRRVKYAISQGQIWSRKRAGEGWRPYRGSNPHDKHAHVSVERAWENDTGDWWPQPKPTPPDPEQEDDMARLIRGKGEKSVYGTDGTVRWHIPNPRVLADLIRAGVYGPGKVTEVDVETVDALPLVNRRA